MNKAADSLLIKENRYYLDKYYSKGIPKGGIRLMTKSIRIIRTFGVLGLLKKLQKKASKGKKYFSDTFEEEYPDVKTLKGRIAVYTAIIDRYDNLLEPKYISPHCDYFIFTDMEISSNSVWRKKDLPTDEYYISLGKYQKAKYFKIFPHKLFPDYDYSVWIDGNILIYGDLAPFVERMGDTFLAEFEHPTNNCVYDEAFSIVSQGKAPGKEVRKQISAYKTAGFPRHYGLLENSLIIRKHNNKLCIELMNEWWRQMVEHTWRDQLSLTYSMWKCGIGMENITVLGPCWRWNPRLRQCYHI